MTAAHHTSLQTSRRSIKIFYLSSVLAFLFSICLGTQEIYGQSIDSHKKRISQIEKDINYLNSQIASTQKKHKNT
ncbi:MAG: hypothetical protein IKD16_04525, partial [Bacteroidales bacterium]|nr:hypothetical protein [Bacteroidales bacterium]